MLAGIHRLQDGEPSCGFFLIIRMKAAKASDTTNFMKVLSK